MKEPIFLPITASRGQLVEAIHQAQQGAREPVDAHELATVVTDQLERADTAAVALALPLDRLQLAGTWWIGGIVAQTSGRITTLVEAVAFPKAQLRVRRAAPAVTAKCGALTLVLS